MSRVNSTIQRLEISPFANDENYVNTIVQVITALRQWESEGQHQAMFRTLLGMKNLLREVEESIEPLTFLSKFLSDIDQDITIVDICSGKGVFSMLARQIAPCFSAEMKIKQIIMIDKQTKGKINLSHLHGLDDTCLPPIEFHDFDIHSTEFMKVLLVLLSSRFATR
jgi:hypothetical protein